MAVRTNADSAEFYEARGRKDVKDGTIMFRMSVGQIADINHPPLEIDQVADAGHKKHYATKWNKFLKDREQVVEVALENEQASIGE